MFIIMIKYKSMEKINAHLVAHRSFLETGYQQNYFIASGPQNPRTGGVILSQLKDKEQLEGFLADDPFITNDAAEYHIIEFNPVKFHPDFAGFL